MTFNCVFMLVHLNKCAVCGSDLQRGHIGDWCLSSSILFKYASRWGHCLFLVGPGYDGFNWSNLLAVTDWGDANSRFLGLVSAGTAQSLDQTALRPSAIKYSVK